MGRCLNLLFGRWILFVLGAFLYNATAFVPFQHAGLTAIKSATNGKVAQVQDPKDHNDVIRRIRTVRALVGDTGISSDNDPSEKPAELSAIQSFTSDLLKTLPAPETQTPTDASAPSSQLNQPQESYDKTLSHMTSDILNDFPSSNSSELDTQVQTEDSQAASTDYSSVVKAVVKSIVSKLSWSAPDPTKKDEASQYLSSADEANKLLRRIHNTSLVGPISPRIPKRLHRDLNRIRVVVNRGDTDIELDCGLFHKVMRAWIKAGHEEGPLMAWNVHKEMVEQYHSKQQQHLRPTPKSYLILLGAYHKGQCPSDVPTPDMLVDEMISFGISNVTEAVMVFEAAAACVAKTFPYNPSRMKKILRTYKSLGFPPNANILSKQLLSATAASVKNSTTTVLRELKSMTIQSNENLRIPLQTYHRILRTAIGTNRATSNWALDLFNRMSRPYGNGGLDVRLKPETFEIMLDVAEKCKDPSFGARIAMGLLRPLQGFVWKYWRESRPASGQIFQLHVHFFNALMEILVRNAKNKNNSFRDIFRMADRLNSLSKSMESIAKREGNRPAVASTSGSTHRVLIRALSQVDSPAAGKLSEAALRSYMSIPDPNLRRKSVEPFEDVVLACCNNTREGTLHAEKLLEEAEHLYAKGVLLQAPSVEVYYELCHSAMQSNTTDHMLKYVSKVWKKIEKGESFSDPPLFIYDFCIREHCKLGLPGCAARLVDKVMREARSGKAWLVPSEDTLSLVLEALKSKGMEDKYPIDQYRQWVVKNADKLKLMSQCQENVTSSSSMLPETSRTSRRVRNRRASSCTFR